MKKQLSIIIILIYFFSCSSNTNPLSRNNEKEVETAKIDTFFITKIDTFTKVVVDTLTKIDTICYKDTIYKEIEKIIKIKDPTSDLFNINNINRIVSCKVFLTKKSIDETIVSLQGFVFSPSNDSITINQIKTNSHARRYYQTDEGVSSFNFTYSDFYLKDTMRVTVDTDCGPFSGKIVLPKIDDVSLYFNNIKLDEQNRVYIHSNDSLGFFWSNSSSDCYKISFDYFGKDYHYGDSIKTHVDTLVYNNKVTFNNSYFPYFANGVVKNISILPMNGKTVGSERPNMSGDGIGYLSSMYTDMKYSDEILVKY